MACVAEKMSLKPFKLDTYPHMEPDRSLVANNQYYIGYPCVSLRLSSFFNHEQLQPSHSKLPEIPVIV